MDPNISAVNRTSRKLTFIQVLLRNSFTAPLVENFLYLIAYRRTVVTCSNSAML